MIQLTKGAFARCPECGGAWMVVNQAYQMGECPGCGTRVCFKHGEVFATHTLLSASAWVEACFSCIREQSLSRDSSTPAASGRNDTKPEDEKNRKGWTFTRETLVPEPEAERRVPRRDDVHANH